jgi:putative tryptophan/tyrosine transport system substrate-binding protein
MIARRELITMLGAAAAGWPLAAQAQQPMRLPRVGFLGLAPESSFATRIDALRAGLRDLGYIDGKNIVLDFRWAETVDDLPACAAELVKLRVDIIFAPVSTFVAPARLVTSTIPIVFASHADPVGLGHVASLARPGGNITGLSMLLTELSVKALEILKEAVPRAVHLAVVWNPTTPSHVPALRALESASKPLGIELHKVPMRTIEDAKEAFQSMSRVQVGAFLVLASPAAYSDRGARLGELALAHRLPGIFSLEENAQAGGLMSYSADVLDLYRRSAAYIDKILRGTNPAELPVEQASKYKLVINLKTAKALEVEIPPTLLARADEVIE